jgi:cytochrome c oxidase subunit I+III
MPAAGQPHAALVGGGGRLILLLVGSLCVELMRHRLERSGQQLAVVAALVCMLAGVSIDLWAYVEAGLDPVGHAWGATVAALLAYQGLHAVLLAILAPYLWARVRTGRLTAVNRATFDNCALVWHYTTLQAVALAAALRLISGF